jgi:hypothetical protein
MTSAVTTVIDAGGMLRNDDNSPLLAGIRLKCSRCGEWHTVQSDAAAAGVSEGSNERLYWRCGAVQYYSGQIGDLPKARIRRRAGQ